MIQESIPGAHDAERRILSGREWLVSGHDTVPLAAHIVTSRRGYTHHGIYVGNGKVVHYAGLSCGWRYGPVEEVSTTEFSRGQPIRIRPAAKPKFDRRDIVARARSRLGENRYRLLSNNCEHFCEWCEHGESRSWQIEFWRTRPRHVLLAVLRFLERSIRWRAAPLPTGYLSCREPLR